MWSRMDQLQLLYKMGCTFAYLWTPQQRGKKFVCKYPTFIGMMLGLHSRVAHENLPRLRARLVWIKTSAGMYT
jgi:hypothetical protein